MDLSLSTGSPASPFRQFMLNRFATTYYTIPPGDTLLFRQRWSFGSDIYFVVGRLNTAGTVSQRGLLIGAEMYRDHSGVLLIVAHELIHYQQRPIPGD
jgi:hypothetical protein